LYKKENHDTYIQYLGTNKKTTAMDNQSIRQITHFSPARWWAIVSIIIMILCLPLTHLYAQERIRKAIVAGSFYPKDTQELTQLIDHFMENVEHKEIEGKILGLICPHAGYVFSGQVAAYAYKHIEGTQYDTVIILGPSHRMYLKGASVGRWDAYSTPLGKVTVNKDIVTSLLSPGKPFRFVEEAHLQEHAIETQLPFLQRTLKQFDIVPIVMGPSTLEDCRTISESLVDIAKNKNVLFVASSDMSHFPDYTNANSIDKKTLDLIKKSDPELVFTSEKKVLRQGIPNLSTTLCGLNSVVTVMMTVKQLGANVVKILHYANSGDVAIYGKRETQRVVGYGAIAFCRQKK
jgi:MEMO1 family protein